MKEQATGTAPPVDDAGGRGRLAVAAGCLAVLWPGCIAFGLVGVLAPWWQEAFGVGRAQVGAAVFCLLAALGLFMYPAGRWQERVGIARMVAAGSLLCGLNALVAAFATSMAWIYVWAFVHGLSHCLVYIPVLTSVQSWHPERRGLVSGLVSLTYGGSALIMAPLFAWLLAEAGYVSTNLIIGGDTLACGLAATPWLNPRPASAASSLAAGQGPAPPISHDPDPGPRAVLGMASFWRLWGATAFMGAAGITMVSLGVDVGLSKGWSYAQAVGLVAGFSAGSGLGRLAMGWLSDRVDRARLMAVAFLAAGLAYGCLWAWPSPVLAVAAAAVVGHAFGAMFAVTPAVIWEHFGAKAFGYVFGMVFTAYGFLAGALGPALVGVWADGMGGSYDQALPYLGGLCLIAAGLLLGLKPPGGAPAAEDRDTRR